MCLFKLCCLVFEFVFGGGDAIFNHQCCKHRVHLWHKARSATVWSRMLWQGVVSLGTAVSDFLLFWFPCDWTSLASGAAWNRTGLAWLIFRLSSALGAVQPVRLDGRKTQWAVSKSTALDSKHLKTKHFRWWYLTMQYDKSEEGHIWTGWVSTYD